MNEVPADDSKEVPADTGGEAKNLGKPVEATDTAFYKHLDLLQGVIQRMAANSASCKTWCITLTAALLTLAARSEPRSAWLAILVVVTFWYLDAYYLSLERDYIGLWVEAVDKHHKGELALHDLFNLRVNSEGRVSKVVSAAVGSASTLPVYGVLLAASVLIGLWLNGCFS